MKGTTSRDIIEYINLSLENFNVDRNKIYSITTDGAPALTGKSNEFTALFKKSASHDKLSYYCWIHQEKLCPQRLNIKE